MLKFTNGCCHLSGLLSMLLSKKTSPMEKQSVSQEDKYDQELACAEVFVDWLASVNGMTYELDRAEGAYGGRWDFVARESSGKEWLGLEIKSLVLSGDRRQFNDWGSFLDFVSRQFPGRVKGSYFVMASLPWKFRQQEAKNLVEPFIEALNDLALQEGQQGNLGQGIAEGFERWPKKPPTNDEKLWVEQRRWEIIYPPEDLIVWKDSSEGSIIELGASVGQPFDVEWTIIEVMLDILEPDERGQVKPNVQLLQVG